MVSVAIDDLVHRLGKETRKSVVFLLPLLSFKIGELSAIATSLSESLVLLLFGGVTISCCFFLL